MTHPLFDFQAPEFVDEPYTFKVKEGLVGATVGQVKAKDGDIGRNAKIFYKVTSRDSSNRNESE
jgi:hypothetical protein